MCFLSDEVRPTGYFKKRTNNINFFIKQQVS